MYMHIYTHTYRYTSISVLTHIDIKFLKDELRNITNIDQEDKSNNAIVS